MQGTLDMLILRTLQWGKQHGHGIGQMLRTNSDDLFRVEHGSLYPALQRMLRKGSIRSEWRTTEHNRRARYYVITAAGKRQLGDEIASWRRASAALNDILAQ